MQFTEQELLEVKEVLKNDDQYYGEYGRKFLSNSNVDVLINNPKDYGKPTEQTKAMLVGRYFHTAMLEPNKTGLYKVIDVASRNTKLYKEEVEQSLEEMLLLSKEQVECMVWVSIMKSNIQFFDDIYEPGNTYEVPGVEKIRGVWWKGKADIITKDYIIDLKTTSDIQKFSRSAKRYNYDSQCYIYVVDKLTNNLGIFRPTDTFIQGGREKVMNALDQYEKFWGGNPTHDPEHFIIQEELI